ncbi:FtsX-like permease family protein [Paenibacillus sp. N1-5-1-14]|uniref:ABC transporter permease n=1 Tax=Paenibacillus radicibacter TaxID=2972488 RepID=UPI002159991D|nr:ABC transporter permease [Paenibacillus radicibacter]MCR8643417.1 FtsX-like permease family protein [Paenibacillus radicibacter]
MNILSLALANIRKGKSAAISLFILTTIAALLLNIGLMVLIQMNTFYDDKLKQLHDPHAIIVMKRSDYKQDYSDFFKKSAEVKQSEVSEGLLLPSTKFHYGESDLDIMTLIQGMNQIKEISPVHFTEKLNDPQANDIYLPLSFKSSGGYKLGDSITITYQEKKFTYRIAGFFEITMMNTNNNGIMKLVLPTAGYEELVRQLGEAEQGIVMSAVLTDSKHATDLLSQFEEEFPTLSPDNALSTYYEGNFEAMKTSLGFTINIVAMILVAFAAVVLIVSLIVIKFRVSDSIEDTIVNIGVLKAIGYTSWQIISSINFQFILITMSAGIIGTAISYLLLPGFGSIITTMSGLNWNSKFNLVANMISILLIVILVPLITMMSSLRIKKLNPVTALRGGLTTHNFKKNYVPLETSRGGLQFMLGCKTMLMNVRQNMMIIAIMAAITFASVFAIVLYYNVGVDNKAFVHLVGAETSSVSITMKTEADNQQLLTHLKQLPHVEKVSMLDMIGTNIEGKKVYSNVSDDYSKLDNQQVYEGRYPKHDNEITISWVVSNQLGKKIGDQVEVKAGDQVYSYLVTGYSQSMSNMGEVVYFTLQGIKHVIPEYKKLSTKVYLKGMDNQSFIRDMKAQFGNKIQEIMDVGEVIKSQSGIYISAVFAVMLMIIAITVLVVVLLLYLVIKTMIIRRKKELGILKAIGYTTIQLMNQIALSFVPIVIIGVVIGSIFGYFFTNSMLTLLLSGMGTHSVNFVLKLPHIIMLGVAIVMMAYVVSMLVARRIKRISAYGLITE